MWSLNSNDLDGLKAALENLKENAPPVELLSYLNWVSRLENLEKSLSFLMEKAAQLNRMVYDKNTQLGAILYLIEHGDIRCPEGDLQCLLALIKDAAQRGKYA